VILDLDAVHEVGLDFCGCGKTDMDHVAQLVERRLFPATVVQPKTAATFRLLELFEILQYESKISPYEVFTTIARLTDNTGLLEVKVILEIPTSPTTHRPPGSLPKYYPHGARMATHEDDQAGWKSARPLKASV
jgi:hypothetical protein